MLALFKVLADSTRLRLLRVLQQGDFTVQDLMQILDMGQSRISRHLQLLSKAGILHVEKQGTWHYYRLAPEEGFFRDIWPLISSQLNQLADQESDAAGVMRVMSERRKRSQDFFNRHARDWDHLHVELLDLPDYQDFLLALLPEGGLLVEIGAGTGHLLPQLAKKCERMVALDHSPAMVSLARETVAQNRLGETVEVRLAEMKHLPFSEKTVRTVVLNQVLHHAENPAEVLREISRVLEPQGVLVLADLLRHQHDWTRERLADQWLGFRREELEKWFADSDMFITSYREFTNSAGLQSVLLLSAGIINHEKKLTQEDLSDDNRSRL
ncbi:MAG: ArsR/SmtB family transcription factor [Desulfuromonadales bacterium]